MSTVVAYVSTLLILLLYLQVVCARCYRPFKQKADLTFHLRAVHKIGDPVACPHCGKDDFKARASYYVHIRSCKQKN